MPWWVMVVGHIMADHCVFVYTISVKYVSAPDPFLGISSAYSLGKPVQSHKTIVFKLALALPRVGHTLSSNYNVSV